MIAIRQILVPTDLTEPAQLALTYGKAIADAFHASLHLLNVVEESLVYAWAILDTALPSSQKVRDDVKQIGLRQLETLITDEDRERYHPQLAVLTGDPAEDIVRYADERAIDLIVIGTHGRTGLRHILSSSVTEKVVRSSPCPVLTVRAGEHDFVVP
jgi:nucleotide-binding universal stress UspA family protein